MMTSPGSGTVLELVEALQLCYLMSMLLPLGLTPCKASVCIILGGLAAGWQLAGAG